MDGDSLSPFNECPKNAICLKTLYFLMDVITNKTKIFNMKKFKFFIENNSPEVSGLQESINLYINNSKFNYYGAE